MTAHGAVIEIPLSQGLSAIIDAADYERVAQFKWCAARASKTSGLFYAVRNVWVPAEKRKFNISLHRFILDAAPGTTIDHINRNGLDNRRANLRFCDSSGNLANSRSVENETGFRGVRKHRRKYQAYVYWRGKRHSCGFHDTPEMAAKERDKLALKLHGGFALLNFPVAP